MGFFKFRLATPKERRFLREKVFPKVDGVDLVATNCAWMTRSNDLLLEEFRGVPLCSSDAHSVTRFVRRELGKTFSVFPLIESADGPQFIEALRVHIRENRTEPHLSYLGPYKFLRSIAFAKPSPDFP
jgi:hypothetical protein